MAAKIKSGDEVVVISGKDKGKRGKVLKVIHAEQKCQDKVLVEGINKVTKHVKPNPMLQQEGGIVQVEKPIYLCKVAIYNPAKTTAGGADRVNFQIVDGKKVRVFKSNKEAIVQNNK